MTAAELTIDQLSGDVHPHLHRLRADAPVAWVPSIDRWLVTDRSLVVEALRDPGTFTVDDERFTTAQVVGPSMLSLDGPEHDRHRSPFARPFGRRGSASLASSCREIAQRLVDELPSAEADLRRDLAAPLAAETITSALGLVDTDVDLLLGWYREIVAAVEAATTNRADVAGASDAFGALARSVERSRLSDGSLMAAIDHAGDLSPGELHSNAAVLLFGAIETSEGMTANALFHVLRDPLLAARLQSDSALIPAAVDESLRLEPAATLVDRYTTGETRLGNVRLPERAAVSLSLAAANRDPAHFPDPDRFDVDRPNAADHLAFVVGPHACIGMHLARIETEAALSAVLRLPTTPTLADERACRPGGLVFRKPASLVV